jgi:hypothetical protein
MGHFTTSILMVHERIKRVITAKKETFQNNQN